MRLLYSRRLVFLCAQHFFLLRLFFQTLSTETHHHHPSGSFVTVVDESEPLIQPDSKTLGSTLLLVLTWPVFSMLVNHATMVLPGEQT